MNKLKVMLCLISAMLLLQYCSKKNEKIEEIIAGPVVAITINGTEVDEPILPASPYNYLINFPAHIQSDLALNDNTPNTNQLTNDGATLGRVLFYDKKLSKNNTVSCGSCHQQQYAFDDNIALSKGLDGGSTTRNSMAILNLRFYRSGRMFWDERATTLERQALQPIQNHVEMNLTLTELETKVRALNYYPALFQKAFGTPTIDSGRIARALSQFERSIVTYQAKYDRVKQGTETFTPAEAAGEQLFLNALTPNNTCASCHTPPMFLTSNPAQGFALNDANDLGINNQRRFKSGSLRNISNRTRLFHNGSVPNVSTMLNSNAPGSPIPNIPAHSMGPQNIPNMLAFLNTLTDNTILTDPKFSNPFIK
jgi:cytochrome c peroxidase